MNLGFLYLVHDMRSWIFHTVITVSIPHAMLQTLCQKLRQARSCSLDFKMCVGRGQTQNLSEILTSRIKKKKLWKNSVQKSLQTLLQEGGWRMCLLCYFNLLTYRFILYTLLNNREATSDINFREFVNSRKCLFWEKVGARLQSYYHNKRIWNELTIYKKSRMNFSICLNSHGYQLRTIVIRPIAMLIKQNLFKDLKHERIITCWGLRLDV